MKKMLGKIVLAVLVFVPLSTGTGQAAEVRAAESEMKIGYRKDKLDWNIADVDRNPNVLSELTWDDLEIFQVEAAGELLVSFQNHYGADVVVQGSLAGC